ncbi:SapC family protein [Maricaulaceae bacterium EIL42A08]|nr:SapC family protein [Maricaulaceae bacterium EIL42A08]
MADAPAGNISVSGSLPLYNKPEPINPGAHRGKGLKWTDRPFDFLSQAHFVPLTMGEFAPASAHYPIIFLGEQKTPVAAMGLQQGHNLFVNPADGNFQQYAYLPAYVRRYPFVAASHTEEEDKFTVCVDTGSHLFSDKPDEPLFNDADQPSPFLERAIDFVRRFEADVATTRKFVQRMEELDLFDQQQATFQPRGADGQPAGEPQVIATYQAIVGEKLQKVDPKVLAELRDENAYLGAIYAHMLSLGRWEVLIAKAQERAGNASAQQAAGSVTPPPEA